MKKLIFLFAALIISCSLSSQNANPIAIAPSKLNIFYVGVDNPVDIAVYGFKPEDITVKINKGSIKKRGNGQFYVRVSQQGTARITVYANDRNLGSKQFRCKLVPDPEACIIMESGRIRTDFVSKTALLSIIGVSAELEWDFDVRFQVSEFIVKTKTAEYDYTGKSSSNKFTAEQKDMIRKLPRGSELIIEGIKCVGPDGVIRPLNSIVLKIK